MNEIEVNFYDTVSENRLKFAVIAARYKGKWVWCKHKERCTYEIAGGHREDSENISDTAKRELFEETGAIEFDIKPVCVYSVTGKNRVNESGNETFGMLFFADITKLDNEINSEIERIDLFDNIPQKLTYPLIQPYLFKRVQDWLNLQSNPDELWDVYDEKRILTGRTHRRGDIMKKGDYHLVVHIWLQNSKGEFLLTKRTPNKGYPNMWECTGGSALAGDKSITAALREVMEETGLTLDAANGSCLLSIKRENNFCDVWLFKQDFELSDVVFQPMETCGAMLATKAQIWDMNKKGLLVPFSYLDLFFEKQINVL